MNIQFAAEQTADTKSCGKNNLSQADKLKLRKRFFLFHTEEEGRMKISRNNTVCLHWTFAFN